MVAGGQSARPAGAGRMARQVTIRWTWKHPRQAPQAALGEVLAEVLRCGWYVGLLRQQPHDAGWLAEKEPVPKWLDPLRALMRRAPSAERSLWLV